ncbi:MAG: hypothetical protein GXO48_08785 [Chlorobi bacterium]|nr:hypothetical protein [Chlorobiota bacterium]
MLNKILVHVLSSACIFLLGPTNAFGQHKLFVSLNIGKHYTVLFPGFYTGTRYDPYSSSLINQQDYNLKLVKPPSRYRVDKQISVGLYFTQNSYVSTQYMYFESAGSLPCNHYFVYFAHAISLSFNKETNIIKNTVLIVNSLGLSFQYGYIQGGISSFNDPNICSYNPNPIPPPRITVSAFGIGYFPSIHIKLWQFLFATINAQATLYLFGKNAGFQPLQINFMLGLAWKPQINSKNEK